MKKIKTLILIPFILFANTTLNSCNNFNDYRLVNTKVKNLDDFIYLAKSDFKRYLTEERDFVLFVGQAQCYACTKSHEYYRDYISEHETIIYYIQAFDYGQMRADDEIRHDLPDLKFTPTLITFKKGQVIDFKVDTNTKAEVYKNLDRIFALNSYYNINDYDHVDIDYAKYSPNYLNTTKLDELISASGEKMIYFYPPINNLTEYNFSSQYFSDFLISNPTLPFYNFDLSKIGNDLTRWSEFLDKYKLPLNKKVISSFIATFNNDTLVNCYAYGNNYNIININGQFLYEEYYYEELKNLTAGSEMKIMAATYDKEMAIIDEYLQTLLK